MEVGWSGTAGVETASGISQDRVNLGLQDKSNDKPPFIEKFDTSSGL